MALLITRWNGIAATAALAVIASSAQAAESGLLGIRLFDSGVKVVSMYGSPDEIQAVNIGGMSAGGGGGFGAPGGGRGGPGGIGGRGGPTGPGGSGAADLSFGDVFLRQGVPPGKGGGGMGMPGAMPPGAQGGPPGGFPGGGGPPGGFPGRGGAPGGAPGIGGGSAQNATYTRWVYNRSGSRYGFIVDKGGRVVQIEAIGLSNRAVHTAKGVSFGDTFAEVVKKYKTPDGYDIAGDNVLVRYLNRSKVAFRFSRLGENKPQVVTGIVVAAGKG